MSAINQEQYMIKGQIFDIGFRFSDLSYIGEGAYGIVMYGILLKCNSQLRV